MTEEPLLSHPIDLARLAAAGTNVSFAANEAERRRIAAEYGLLDLKRLAADAVLTPGRAGSVRVEGHVMADLVQACVVTLDPVEQSLDEPFARSFVRARAPEAKSAPKPAAEIMVDLDAEDPPEPLDGPRLDLGPIVIEHFLLGIDPYPRAPGAILPAGAADAAEPESPFAALAALRRESPGNT